MNNETKTSKMNVLSAMFLVAGTCIGGGMLALPVATGVSGFFPSIFVMALCWLAMTITALLLLEVSLWMEEGVHVITMTSRLLGQYGKIISWVLYLFICYASIVAYTAGGGVQISTAFNNYWDIPLSKEIGAVIFLVVFGYIVDLGANLVGRINTILFLAMIFAYFGLVGMGVDEIKTKNLLHSNWLLSLLAIPVTLTTFSFQTMVPSLTPYLKRNANGLRWAIIGGTLITLAIYVLWQWMMLGIVPVHGENGLSEALRRGEPATQFVHNHVDGRWITDIAEFFAFFAIATSFLGITLGLFDFLSDGLNIKKEGKGKLFLAAIIFIPTIIFATQFERVFLVAMELSGGIGDAILNGMIPVLMVWIGRYHFGYTGNLRVFGGKYLLASTFAFYFAALVIQLLAFGGPLANLYKEELDRLPKLEQLEHG